MSGGELFDEIKRYFPETPTDFHLREIARWHTQAAKIREEALALLNGDDDQADRLLEAGVAIQVLEDFSEIPENKESGSDDEQVQFVHQLMQEYFAARRLARSPDSRCVETPWRLFPSAATR